MAAFPTLLGLGTGRPPTTARRLWRSQDIVIVGGA